ncbi:isopenicillin N synthase family dioxygenase [Streptomyces telluris]|uniref:Isopenicillin N synthase family oxygenase n=1 Tax=Streptomyces telluris TaxID=2720021 RepID=A0A9X2LHE0_9ACTN|nr:isopenicillin N synthase family oxygenase [Streptomyces telluris]MCQ8771349.1 isopenicillin N synthase family oxygenase [Streptomyces telluris]NJP80665.1 isopenicillin N synthase family oxygenase [Streptomyces telluris]
MADNGSLPVVDLSLADGAELQLQVLAAARETGVFHVIGHGVPHALSAGVLGMARRLFALPPAPLREIENLHSPQFRGYSRLGGEQTDGLPDWREQFDVGPERLPRTLGADDPPYLRLIGPNQWPAALPELRTVTLAWQATVQDVGQRLMRLIAGGLGQGTDYFDRWFDDEAAWFLKLLHYPGRHAGEAGAGIGPHRDYGYLGLLQQDGISGLQVRTRAGEWAEASSRPDTLLIVVGEMLEIASDGYLTAAEHRVVSPPPGTDRYAAAFFLSPRLDAVVEPMPLPPRFATSAGGVGRAPDNPLPAAYGENALRGWLRSHPHVVERWWSDVR